MRIRSKFWVIIVLLWQCILLVLFSRLYSKEDGHVIREDFTITPEDWKDLSVPEESVINWKKLQREGHLTEEVNWNAILRRPLPAVSELHDKWIVLTTINSPTEDVKKLAQIDGWKVVVVGDTKTPVDWR